MEAEYETRDLYEAAYLVAKELKLKGVKRDSQSPRCYFTFENLPECKTAVMEFWNYQGEVVPKKYADAIRNLKDRLYAGV